MLYEIWEITHGGSEFIGRAYDTQHNALRYIGRYKNLFIKEIAADPPDDSVTCNDCGLIFERGNEYICSDCGEKYCSESINSFEINFEKRKLCDVCFDDAAEAELDNLSAYEREIWLEHKKYYY